MNNSAAGISIIAFIIAVAASMAYYQFVYTKEARGTLGINNKVIWTNLDTTAHTVTTDTQYTDQINGPFNSIDTIGLIPPQKTFEFTFTKDGEYAYHCEPHPWMTGKVVIVKSFV